MIEQCSHYFEKKNGEIKVCTRIALFDKLYCYQHQWLKDGKKGKKRYFPSVSNPQVVLDILL